MTVLSTGRTTPFDRPYSITAERCTSSTHGGVRRR